MTIQQLIERSQKTDKEMQRLLREAGKIAERIYQLSITRRRGIKNDT